MADARASKILIVDDEPFNVDLLEQELEDLGYVTMAATNGQEALDKVAAETPDLILLDIMMPVMDGFSACRRLKENDETRLIPVVIMTALDGLEDRIRGIEAGADDFLTKPVNPRELTARIQTALRLKHTVDRKLSELRRIKDHFAKFVPQSVKRLITANPDAPELAKVERDVSVLFCDVSGYTRLSERLPRVRSTRWSRATSPPISMPSSPPAATSMKRLATGSWRFSRADARTRTRGWRPRLRSRCWISPSGSIASTRSIRSRSTWGSTPVLRWSDRPASRVRAAAAGPSPRADP